MHLSQSLPKNATNNFAKTNTETLQVLVAKKVFVRVILKVCFVHLSVCFVYFLWICVYILCVKFCVLKVKLINYVHN